MQDILNPKIFELERLKHRIKSYKNALHDIEDKINYLDILCVENNRRDTKNTEKNILASKKETLQRKLDSLEHDRNKLNTELIDNESISEVIKIKYALLLSGYAAYHDNPTAKPKKEVKTFIQKLMDFNRF